MKLLSRQEELLLLTIWKLKDEAYGVPIREEVTSRSGKYWSIGAIYDVLDRLTRKGYVNTHISAPVAERGGKSRKYYEITEKGFAALEQVKKLHDEMWTDLPSKSI